MKLSPMVRLRSRATVAGTSRLGNAMAHTRVTRVDNEPMLVKQREFIARSRVGSEPTLAGVTNVGDGLTSN